MAPWLIPNLIVLQWRLLAQAICLTASDLNSSSKPWAVQEKTTKVVYEEFHEQVNIKNRHIFCSKWNYHGQLNPGFLGVVSKKLIFQTPFKELCFQSLVETIKVLKIDFLLGLNQPCCFVKNALILSFFTVVEILVNTPST